MAKDADDFIPTRQSLLTRLKSWDDQESWRQFFDTYWNVIYGLALKSGLTDPEAQDVVQETLLAVAKKMPGFNYDPAIGSFKSWLFRITQRRIADQFRKRPTRKLEAAAGLEPIARVASRASPESSDGTRTATIERVADP